MADRGVAGEAAPPRAEPVVLGRQERDHLMP